MRLASAAAVLVCGVFAACSHPSTVRQLGAGATSERYLDEFAAAETQYPGGERAGSRAPVGDAEVVLKREFGIPLISDGCHSVWLKNAAGVKRILKVREADPGSGSSFGFSWSGDGQAAFIFGGHSGIDCAGPVSYDELRIIYTLADGVAWVVPKSRGRPTRG